MRILSSRIFVALFSALSLAACKVEVKANGPITTLDVQSGIVLTCSAELDASAGGSAISGVAVPISVKVNGGIAPYQIVDSAVAFNSETVLSRTYTNTGSAPITVVDTVVTKDSSNHVTQCNFLVTVNPDNYVPTDLACTLVATPSSPQVNQVSSFQAVASGGTSPYTFSNFVPGTSGQIISPLTATSLTQASATASYPTSGLRTASVTLTDDLGEQVICSSSVNVAPLPSVAVVAAPATAVVFGNAITLTATPSNFSGTPTYSFTTTRSGVTISRVNNVATVTSSAAQSAFDVVVTATSGTQVATSTISLSFLNPSSLACSLSHPAGTYYPGSPIAFSVTATNGDALLITSATSSSDATLVSSTDSSRTISYSTAGTKTLWIEAKSKVTGALCQAGAVMSDSVVVSPPVSNSLSCTGVTFYNPSYEWEWFRATATISGGSGLKWVDTISITKSGSTYNGYDGEWIDGNSAWLRIWNDGTYVVKFNLKDTNGNTGSCTVNHVVWN